MSIDVELGDRRDIAGNFDRAAEAVQSEQPVEKAGIAFDGERDIGQRSQCENDQFMRMGPRQFAEQLGGIAGDAAPPCRVPSRPARGRR